MREIEYKTVDSRHYQFFCDPFGVDVDIFLSPTGEALKKLAKSCVEQTKTCLQLSQSSEQKTCILKNHLDSYLILNKGLCDFYSSGMEGKATNLRSASNFNVQDAKVDYYFNWDARFIISVSEHCSHPLEHFALTFAASILLSPFILLNALLQLLPLKHCFNKGDDALTDIDTGKIWEDYAPKLSA